MVLFDIDGTLVSGGGLGIHSLNKAFEEVFSVGDVWGETIAHGKTDPQIVQEIAERVLSRALTTPEQNHLIERYLDYFKHEISNWPGFSVLSGAETLCQELSARDNMLLGIETGNVEPAAHLKLQRGNLSPFFRFGGFGSDSVDRAEIIQFAIARGAELLGVEEFPVELVVVIGDAPQDIAAGKTVGVRTIGVGTGRNSAEELSDLGADAVLSDLSNIEQFLKALESCA